MHSHSTMPIVRQGGQIVPVALFGILIASTVLAIMFDTSQKITEKSRVANAADAAAYSAAVWTARHLNFMAYINRAMIANHAAVGHFVSYVSWIRYVDDSIDHLDDVTQWIPYVGQYVDVVQRIAGEVREATERQANVAVPAIDRWNTVLRAAQLETQLSLAADGLQDLMARTASAYDPTIHINDTSALKQLPDELRDVLEAQLIEQSGAVPGFIHRYSASNDRNSVSQLIDASRRTNADLQHWLIGNRGWREDLLAVQIRKRGNSMQTQGASSADWQSADDLQFRKRNFLGWQRWTRIGDKSSTATAHEFASTYAGVPKYFNVTGAPADRSLPILAIATRSSDIAASTRLNATAEDYPIVVASLARVEFRRSSSSAFVALAGNRQEYSNLFNPFWEAHLAALESKREVP